MSLRTFLPNLEIASNNVELGNVESNVPRRRNSHFVHGCRGNMLGGIGDALSGRRG